MFKRQLCCLFSAEFVDLLPDDMIPKNYLTFRHVVPVSAITGFGVDQLKTSIRQSLDEQAAAETQAIHQEKLQELRYHSHERSRTPGQHVTRAVRGNKWLAYEVFELRQWEDSLWEKEWLWWKPAGFTGNFWSRCLMLRSIKRSESTWPLVNLELNSLCIYNAFL